MKKVMIKDVVDVAIKYNKGLVSSVEIYSILYNYNRDHKCIMTYNMNDDSIELTDDNKITELFLVDTENHYRKVRTVWRSVEEEKVTLEDVVEAVEKFNDEMIESVDLYDVVNQYGRQHSSKIDVCFIEEHKVGKILLIIANGLIKRVIWEINGKDIEKRFEKYVLNHVKNDPVIGKEPRSFRIDEDIKIRIIPLVCGFIAYERLNSDGIAENTVILNREGKRLTKPRLWQVCDYIAAEFGADDVLRVVSNVIQYYNASRRCKLTARIFKGKIIISRHDKGNRTRVVYGGVNHGK